MDGIKNILKSAKDSAEHFGTIDFYHDRNKLFTTAKYILDTVDTVIEQTDPIPLILDVKPGEPDATKVWVVQVKGGKVFPKVPMPGATEESKFVKTFYSLDRNDWEIVVSASVDDLKAGIITADKFASHIYNARMWRRIRTLWAALDSAFPAGGSYTESIDMSAADAEETFDGVVADVIEYGGAKAIVGPWSAVMKLKLFTDSFSNEAKEEFRLRGMIGTYLGIPVIALKSYRDPLYEENALNVNANSLNSIYILSEFPDWGDFRVFKEAEPREETVVKTKEWKMYVEEAYGVGIYMPQYCRRVIVS